jgi:phosphoribosylglycinamide formyltransferase-1
MSARIAALASGRGSNVRAVAEYLAAEQTGDRIVLVVSDRPGAGALTLARELGVDARVMEDPASPSAALAAWLRECEIDIVVLAGYLRLLPAAIVREYRGRIINVHPALLPAFGGKGMYGERVHRAVLSAGSRVSGVTVHFVDEVYDRGAIIAQWPVPVFTDDTQASLAERVLRVEHQLLPRVVRALAAGHITLGADNRVRGVYENGTQSAAFTLQPDEGGSVAHAIDAVLAR